MKRALLYLSLSILCVSCACSRMKSKLDQIEPCVYEDPNEAFSMLASIDSSSLKSSKLRARHSLLKALALNRLYSDTTDIEVILPAVRYYEKHGPDSCRMKSEYCQGWIFYNQKDIPSAYVCYKESEKYVTEITDARFKVMLYSALGSVCATTNHVAEWLDYVQRWLPETKKTNRLDWIVSGTFELSAALGSNRKIEEADSVFRFAVTLLEQPNISGKVISYAAHAAIVKHNNDPELSCKLYEQVLAAGDTLSDDHWHAYAYALQCCGREKKTFRILDSLASHPGTRETCFWRYRVARRQGDYLAALEHCEEYSSRWSQEMTESQNRSVYKVIADQKETLAERNAARAERLRLIVLLIVALALALIGFFSLMLYRRRVMHQTERDRLESIAETARRMSDELQEEKGALQSRLDAAHRDIATLHSKLEYVRTSLFAPYQSQLAELGRLCEKQVMRKSALAGKQAALTYSSRRVEELLAEIAAGPERQAELEDEINRNLDNAIAKFRSDFPEATDQDVLLLCYMVLHFDTSTIALLTGLSKDNVRQKKHRLLKKIEACPASENELYRLLL